MSRALWFKSSSGKPEAESNIFCHVVLYSTWLCQRDRGFPSPPPPSRSTFPTSGRGVPWPHQCLLGGRGWSWGSGSPGSPGGDQRAPSGTALGAAVGAFPRGADEGSPGLRPSMRAAARAKAVLQGKSKQIRAGTKLCRSREAGEPIPTLRANFEQVLAHEVSLEQEQPGSAVADCLFPSVRALS